MNRQDDHQRDPVHWCKDQDLLPRSKACKRFFLFAPSRFELEELFMLEALLGGCLEILGELVAELVGEFLTDGIACLWSSKKRVPLRSKARRKLPKDRQSFPQKRFSKKTSGPRRCVEQGAESSTRCL